MPKDLSKRTIALDSSPPGILINIYQSSPSQSSSSQQTSPTSVRRSLADLSLENAAAPVKRHNPYARNDKQPKRKDVPDDHLSKFKINFSNFPHKTIRERYTLVNQFFQDFSSDCVYHLLIRSDEASYSHSSLSECDCELGTDSHYRDVFRSAVKLETSACYRCACPLVPIFQHGKEVGTNCQQDGLAEFIKPIPYIVLNSPQLRQPIFDFLGVETEHFLKDQIDFAIWLGRKSRIVSPTSNLIELVYATALLHGSDGFPVDSAFILPGKPLSVCFFYLLTILLEE
jgi:hypothetical protein